MFCRYSITRMDPKKHVFLLTPMDSNSKDAPFVAKVVATPYPEQLHEELFCSGLAPKLREPVQKYPGGMILYFCAVASNLCSSCCNIRVVSYCLSIGFPLLSVLRTPNVRALPPSQASAPCAQCLPSLVHVSAHS